MKICANTKRVRLENKEDFTSGGYNDIEIEVELSNEYTNLYNFVTFGNVCVPIIEGKIKTPTLTAGVCRIGVYGFEGNDKINLRYSPIPVDVYVKKGSYNDKVANQTVPLPTEFEKCVNELRDLLQEAVISDGAVTTDKVADSAITSPKIATGAVVGAKIGDKAITRTKLADGSVITAKLDDLSVTNDKIDSKAVSLSKLADDVIKELNFKALKTEVPRVLSKLYNDTDFKEYVQINDESTANSYVSENGRKHKLLTGSNFYLAYFPNEVSTQHTNRYRKAGKVKKAGEENEYVLMYLSGIAVNSTEILLDDNGEVDLTFYTNNEDFNYGGTSSYRVLFGKPQVSDGYEITSDWDDAKGNEMKGDCLLGDKSSENKSYAIHLKQTVDSNDCIVFCDVLFQKYERSGLTMKWVTKDTQIMSIDIKVTKPKDDAKFKGLYFISANDTLLLSANTDLSDKLGIIETALENCVKKNEPLNFVGEIVFDGTQTNKEYDFEFNKPFQKIYAVCEDLTSQASQPANIYFSVLGSKGIAVAGNEQIGKSGSKRSGLFTVEHFGDFMTARNDNFWTDKTTFTKIVQTNKYSLIAVSFDDIIPTGGKVSIYYV